MKGKQKNSDELREELFQRYPKLESCRESIIEAYYSLLVLYRNGGKLLIAGNGGSSFSLQSYSQVAETGGKGSARIIKILLHLVH